MTSPNQTPRAWLEEGLGSLNLKITPQAIDKICIYFAELKKWSKKINLIGQADDKQIVESHFIDSLTMLPLIENNPSPNLLDIGSGAGFPGLVLKMALPELKVTLVEPRQKRASFLGHICRTTKVLQAEVVCRRLEENDTNFIDLYGQFPIVTSRAVTQIREFISLVSPVVAPAGQIICMKGPQADQELTEWQKSNPPKTIAYSASHHFNLPFSKAERSLVVFTKTS